MRTKSGENFVVSLCLFVFLGLATPAAPPNKACDLPKDLQQEIASKFPGTQLVSLSDLGEYDKALFQKDHDDACPGLVKVDFYGDGNPTFALLLATKTETKAKTQLVRAHRAGPKWRVTVLDAADGPIPVVWSEKPGEYKGVYGKKIHATRPVIIFCGYSSWAVLYAWTGKGVQKVQISD